MPSLPEHPPNLDLQLSANGNSIPQTILRTERPLNRHLQYETSSGLAPKEVPVSQFRFLHFLSWKVRLKLWTDASGFPTLLSTESLN